MPLVYELEEALAPFQVLPLHTTLNCLAVAIMLDLHQARPHWGKLYSHGPEALQALYTDPGVSDGYVERFGRLRRELDPTAKFSSSSFARCFLPAGAVSS